MPTKPPAPLGKLPKRSNGGRKLAPATKRSHKAASRIAEGNLYIRQHGEPEELDPKATPLDVMMMAMKVAYRVGGALHAHEFARDCAPYVHARIAQMELKNHDDKPFALSFAWVTQDGSDDAS